MDGRNGGWLVGFGEGRSEGHGLLEFQEDGLERLLCLVRCKDKAADVQMHFCKQLPDISPVHLPLHIHHLQLFILIKCCF